MRNVFVLLLHAAVAVEVHRWTWHAGGTSFAEHGLDYNWGDKVPRFCTTGVAAEYDACDADGALSNHYTRSPPVSPVLITQTRTKRI
jgi:hypothetical protein